MAYDPKKSRRTPRWALWAASMLAGASLILSRVPAFTAAVSETIQALSGRSKTHGPPTGIEDAKAGSGENPESWPSGDTSGTRLPPRPQSVPAQVRGGRGGVAGPIKGNVAVKNSPPPRRGDTYVLQAPAPSGPVSSQTQKPAPPLHPQQPAAAPESDKPRVDV